MIALLLLAVSASAATAPAPLAAPRPRPYWLKAYAPAPYQEIWRTELKVKKLDDALPKVVAAVEKSGGRLTQPLSNFIGSISEKQMSLIVPQSRAADLLKALRKIGKAEKPVVRPGGEPIPLSEVREKLERLTKEKADKKDALAQAPAASDAVDEMIEYLTGVESAARAERGVLWNITVKDER